MDNTSQINEQNDKLVELLAPACGCGRCGKPGRHTITLNDARVPGGAHFGGKPLCWSCWSTSRREMGIGV